MRMFCWILLALLLLMHVAPDPHPFALRVGIENRELVYAHILLTLQFCRVEQGDAEHFTKSYNLKL